MPDEIKKSCQKRANCEHKGLQHLHAAETMDRSLGARYRTKQQLILHLILLVLLFSFIVSNGDILTDRTDERKHLRRKYNDL